jgi:hypothetical protein
MAWEDWQSWVMHEVQKKAQRFQASSFRDTRSPRDIMEDILPEKRCIGEITEPLYDVMVATEKLKHGPFDPREALPDILWVRGALGLSPMLSVDSCFML